MRLPWRRAGLLRHMALAPRVSAGASLRRLGIVSCAGGSPASRPPGENIAPGLRLLGEGDAPRSRAHMWTFG